MDAKLGYEIVDYHTRPGVGKFFFALRAIVLKKERKLQIVHELQSACVEKATPRAVQKVFAGRIWPAGRSLPTPVLGN
jgi:hypothetical protein